MSEFSESRICRPASHPESPFLPPSEPASPPDEEASEPLDAVSDGDRDAGGRFVAGNKAAKGNPVAKQAAALRTELFACCTREAMRDGVQALLAKFAKGDTQAAKLVLGYVLGPPESLDLIATVTRLESLVFKIVTPEGENQ